MALSDTRRARGSIAVGQKGKDDAFLWSELPFPWEEGYDATQVGRCVVGVCEKMAGDQRNRVETARRLAGVYEGRKMEALYSSSFSQNLAKQDIVLPIARRVVDWITTEVATSTLRKPKFLTDGANWKQRRKAIWCERFVEAGFHQPQGKFSNMWELVTEVQRNCAKFGACAVKTYADSRSQGITAELINFYDLFVDDGDAEYGDPKNIFHLHRYSRRELVSRFGEKTVRCGGRQVKLADFIWDAAVPKSNTRWGSEADERDDMVQLYESYRKPISSDEPGRHVIGIGGNTPIALVDEPWTRKEFPYRVLRYWVDMAGYWGTGVCQVLETIQGEVNDLEQAIQENTELMASGFIEIEDDAQFEEDMQNNDIWNIVRRPVGATPAVIHTPPPFPPQLGQRSEVLQEKCFSMTGASMQGATARKEANVQSGIAIQEVNDLSSRALVDPSRRLDNFFVGLALDYVRAACDLAEEVPNFSLSLPGSKFLRTIDFSRVKDFANKEDMYHITVMSSSNLPTTAAGRIDRVVNWQAAGAISPIAAKRIVDETLDLKSLESRERAQEHVVDRQLDNMLDADEETWDFAEDWEGPDELLPSVSGALFQMQEGYTEALAEGADEFNLDLVRRWINEADLIIQRAEQARTAMQPMQPPMQVPGVPAEVPVGPQGPVPPQVPLPPEAPMPPMPAPAPPPVPPN